MRSRLWTNPAYPAIAGVVFDDAWTTWQGEVVDENRLRRVERVATAAGTAYLKRFFGIQPKNELKLRLLQGPRCSSQAMRERLVIEKLAAGGFGPPVVLAAGDETTLGHERRSLLLTAPLAGRPLSEHPAPGADLVRGAAAHLGRAVAHGVFLPDLGLDHVWLDGDRFGLLDFHNARFTPAPSPRELGRAVVRFFKSPGGAALLERGLLEPFIQSYLGAASRDEASGAALTLCRRRLAG